MLRALYTTPQRGLALITGLWLIIFALTRAVLYTHCADSAALTFSSAAAILATGTLYDISFLILALAPIALLFTLTPNSFWQRPAVRWLLATGCFIAVYLMLFTALAEYLFWDEFGVRFNFIAVDYLVYSDEVLNNILESYPVYPLLAALALLAAAISALLIRHLLHTEKNQTTAPTTSTSARLSILSVTVAFICLAALPNQQLRDQRDNTYQRELASNGPFQFFAAFRNNELSYTQFYAQLDSEQLQQQLTQELQPGSSNTAALNTNPLVRQVHSHLPALKANVILVTIESLSAKYLGVFGDTRGLTPTLDTLATQSLFFDNVFATGTRTDRGLEAITLSLPPTPGRSIVKRIGRETGYASLGQQFLSAGYDSAFLYGGRGYFDNMSAFFSGNGYRVLDQSSVPNSEMQFTNAWGMSDEDLYRQAIKQADINFAANKAFFLQLMTTSNHRPYTYPEGRIDIPSGTGRTGAVKYTDYAIGQFLAAAKTKPWFDNTIFVFVADHTAGSAGKADLPPDDYHIPLFIYAPKLLPAQRISALTSQIDLAPTLLGLLHFSYQSRFYGRDVFAADAQQAQPRVLIGNYQHLGLFDGSDLAILSPRQQLRRRDNARQTSAAGDRHVDTSDQLIQRAISYYQSADYAFQHQQLQWQSR